MNVVVAVAIGAFWRSLYYEIRPGDEKVKVLLNLNNRNLFRGETKKVHVKYLWPKFIYSVSGF